MHTLLKRQVIALAEATPTQEICGFFHHIHGTANPSLFHCPNVAANPTEEFEISTQDQMTARMSGELLGTYHSHPRSAAFSQEDIDYASELNIPSYLYSIPDKQWYEYIPPEYQVDLTARPYSLGFGGDCFGLVRDYFRQTHSIFINDYVRDESFIHEDQGVIMASFEKEGFEIMPKGVVSLQTSDVIMFKTDKALPQHFAVFKGHHNLMLHHPLHSLSREEMLTDRWLKRLVCIFRHKSLRG